MIDDGVVVADAVVPVARLLRTPRRTAVEGDTVGAMRAVGRIAGLAIGKEVSPGGHDRQNEEPGESRKKTLQAHDAEVGSALPAPQMTAADT